jgi:hypothetical protein
MIQIRGIGVSITARSMATWQRIVRMSDWQINRINVIKEVFNLKRVT